MDKLNILMLISTVLAAELLTVYGLQCYENTTYVQHNGDGSKKVVPCNDGSCVTVRVQATGDVVVGCWPSKIPSGRYIVDFCNTDLCNHDQVWPNLMMLFRNGHNSELMYKLK